MTNLDITDPDLYDRQPCGESDCICYGMGPEHADCACGCDCPRYWDEAGSHKIGDGR